MRTRTKTTAIALTGAVALASGAYALGTQTGGGSADAADAANPPSPSAIRAHFPGGGRPFGLDNLADRLGVDESALEDALDDVRSNLPDPDEVRGNFAEDLAKELGIDAKEVEDALDRLQDKAQQGMEQRRDELAKQLADRLNLDVDKVKDALGDSPFWGFRLARPPHTP
jgi:energy-converting hydrogenase A subunit M